MQLSYRKVCSYIFVLTLAVTLVFSTVSGAYGVSVCAAEDLSTTADSSVDNGNNAILGGVLAVGLIGLLSHHGSSSAGQDSGAKSAPTPSQPTTTQPTSGTTPVTQPAGSTATMEKQMLALVNQDRAQQGLPALTWNSSLAAVGRAHSQDMVTRNYFAHNTPEGVTPFQRMDQAGIHYNYAGENIALNSSVAAAEQAFMNSPGHRANILNKNYTQIGIGIVQNGSQIMVSQEFIG